jgi:hypothetical protein
VFIKGANLHIVNGLGSTDCINEQGEEIPDCPNGVGNLIVGYNEPREGNNVRTGSHNVVVGEQHNFSRFGGLVVGVLNTISGDIAVVNGGQFNIASGNWSSVSGGGFDTGAGTFGNIASGSWSSVSGGWDNTASGVVSAVSGGVTNRASGDSSRSISMDWTTCKAL